MKKLLSVILAVVMVLSLATVAFAEETQRTEDMTQVIIQKTYSATNTGTTSPAETFSFDVENTSVADAAADVTVKEMPELTIGTVTYAAGEAGSETMTKNIIITLPEYTSVGVYTYTVTEKADSNTAGVTYHSSAIKVVVTVIQDGDNKVRVAAVHTESVGGEKSNAITNVYSAGTLSVQKVVTGNLGDQTKEFKVTVTFTAPEGKTVNEAIAYNDGEEKTIAGGWTGVKTVELYLKHGKTVTFTNIPYGVAYTVVEADYTGDGYDPAGYAFSDENKTIDTAADSVVITNNKQAGVDTGITLDSIPFVLMLVVCAGAAVLFVTKRRTVEF